MSEPEKPVPQGTCPVKMSDGNSCGRLLHDAPEGVDKQQVCLMHSRDPDKDRKKFREEIDAIIIGKLGPLASEDYDSRMDRLDFTGFVFLEAEFKDKIFSLDAYFERADFCEVANFANTMFSGDAKFFGATFTQEAHFFSARFAQEVDFGQVIFHQDVYFCEARFNQRARFILARFDKFANFHGVDFKQPTEVSFRQANKKLSIILVPGVALYRTKSLSVGLQARFLNCQIEQVHFEDVNWCRDDGRMVVKGRMVIQDELDLRLGRHTDYELVGEVYRRLINSFERARAYDHAEDCSIGAMEMKRLDIKQPWFTRFGLRFYRWASLYGSDYFRALKVLLALVFLFGLFFALPWSGLDPSPLENVHFLLASNNLAKACEYFKAGLVHAVESVTFLRNPLYTTTRHFGQIVSGLGIVFVTSQVAFLLLALRRRFRR